MGRRGYIGEKYVKNLLEKDGWHVIWTGNQNQMSEDQFGCDLIGFRKLVLTNLANTIRLLLVQVKSTKGNVFYNRERENKQYYQMLELVKDVGLDAGFYYVFRKHPKNILKIVNVNKNIILPKKIVRDKNAEKS